MEFGFSKEQELFRNEILAFVKRELPKEWGGVDFEGEAESLGWEFTRKISKKLAEKGWLTLAWPKEYGGQARSILEQLVYREATSYHQVPGVDMGVGGVSWVGPMLMSNGTEEQKQHLKNIGAGEEYWCTLYSEPGSGSDLASLETRAEADGDDYVINGQKIWTSGGHRADYGWLAARTDPAAAKHKGVSMLLLDMKAPGVSVRPIINMAGDHNFNEVFFDNVRVPKRNLVGDENRGWYLLAAALDFERSGVHASANGRRTLEQIGAFWKSNKHGNGLHDEVVNRTRYADMWIECDVAKAMAYRVAWMQSVGQDVNQEASISKLFGSEFSQRLARFGAQFLGLYGQLAPKSKWARLKGSMEKQYLWSVSATIAAGTSEVQRNIVAMRGLGLPR